MLVNLFFSFLNAAPSLIFLKISVLHSFQGTFSAFWFVWFCLYISHFRLYSSIWLSLIICSYLRVGDKKSDQKLWDFPISGFISWHYIRASLGGTCIISILRISLMGWPVCPDKNPPICFLEGANLIARVLRDAWVCRHPFSPLLSAAPGIRQSKHLRRTNLESSATLPCPTPHFPPWGCKAIKTREEIKDSECSLSILPNTAQSEITPRILLSVLLHLLPLLWQLPPSRSSGSVQSRFGCSGFSRHWGCGFWGLWMIYHWSACSVPSTFHYCCMSPILSVLQGLRLF